MKKEIQSQKREKADAAIVHDGLGQDVDSQGKGLRL